VSRDGLTRRGLLAGLLQAAAVGLASCATPRATPGSGRGQEQARVASTRLQPTAAPSPSRTATAAPTATRTPTAIPAATATRAPTATQTYTATPTATTTPTATAPPSAAARAGRLLARPGSAVPGEAAQPGPRPLGLAAGRDGVLYVSKNYDKAHPAPLLVMFHGAAGYGGNMIAPFEGLIDQGGWIALAPDSRERTWDVVHGGFGPDIEFLDRALADVFGRFAVDPARVAVAGFSDGATYALAVGLTNGDLFRRVVAFSPGLLRPGKAQGKPSLYISHGAQDSVLRIGWSSRAIVPKLRKEGYDVLYHEFEGGHGVPEEIAEEAFEWLSEPGTA
jgi:phospholipase/carboxylesterase